MAAESAGARWQRREAEKWAVFRDQIGAQNWEPIGPDGHGGIVSALSNEWLKALFEVPYLSLLRSVDADTGAIRAVMFLTQDGTHEVRVASRVKPGEWYDFRWGFRAPRAADDDGLPCGHVERRVVPARRSAGDDAVGTANAVWLIAPERAQSPASPADTVIRLFCPELDETIDVTLASLAVAYRETPRQQQARAEANHAQQFAEAETEARPWQALFHWMLQLRQIDAAAFGRIPPPVRAALVQNAITPALIAQWQMQGLLPPRPARLDESRAGEVRASIQLQKTLTTQPAVTMAYTALQMPLPFPPLVLAVDPKHLAVPDLQAFMTIGALRELHGALDERLEELARTDPSVRARVQGPGGKAQLLQDPKYAELLADPRMLQEVLEEQDIQQRRQGKFGPTDREAAAMLQQRQQDMMSMLGNPMFGMGAGMGLLGGPFAGSRPAPPGSPPWKLYEPYLC